MKDEGWRMKDEGGRRKEEGWKFICFPSSATYFNLPYLTYPSKSERVKGWKDADAISFALNHPLLSSPWLRGGMCRVSLLQCMACYDILVVMQHTSSLCKGEIERGWWITHHIKKVKKWKGEKVKGWKSERVKKWKGEKVKRWKGADATLKGERVVVAF